MSLILPHRMTYARHSILPWLWRIKCSCGFAAYAPSEPKARACIEQHLLEEEPFPEFPWLASPEGEKPNG